EGATPRFDVSNNPNRMGLDLQAGRVRVDIPPFEERPLEMTVTTPQGASVDIRRPGRYVLEVSNDTTQVTVQNEGEAGVSAMGEVLMLGPGQRAEVELDAPPGGPFDPARDLIRNGDFSDGLDNWALFSWQVELPDQ